MACDSRGHRHLVLLPERGAALDIGEEEGDGAGGEIGHDPLQTLGGTWCCSIVAWEETVDRPSEGNRAV